MLRLPKGMTLEQFFARQKKRREATKDKRKFLNRDKPRKIRYSQTMLRGILDDLFALWIKRRDTAKHGRLCRICGKRPGTVAYHLVPKCTINYLARWHDENAVLACAPCNNGERWHRKLYNDKARELFGGELMDRMEKLGRGPSNWGIGEMQDRVAELRKALARREP